VRWIRAVVLSILIVTGGPRPTDVSPFPAFARLLDFLPSPYSSVSLPLFYPLDLDLGAAALGPSASSFILVRDMPALGSGTSV
jgi:hypothetical protein